MEPNQLDHIAKDYHRASEFDVDAAWESVNARLKTPAPAAPRPARVRILTVVGPALAIAASLLFIFWLMPGVFGDRSTVITNEGTEILTYELPDGTQVQLQGGSALRHPSDFGQSERRIELEGQAYFEVVPNPAAPFLVGNDVARLIVTGTAFNLRVANDELEVDVTEGSVRLERDAHAIDVGANHCGLVTKRAKKPRLMPAPDHNRHAWRTGKFTWRDKKLGDIVPTIENALNLSIEGVGPDCAGDVSVSGNFDASNVAAFLERLGLLAEGHFESTGTDKTYRFVGNCE